LRLQEYYSKVPGLGLSLIGDGSAPTITIRGITTGGLTNPAVGVVIDEIPYGATVSPGTSPVVPDIDPGDLARIEVLRGPQGTLYGASSIGGLLKFVTIDPTTREFSGRVTAGLSKIAGGNDVGYNIRGSINAPLTDSLAVRASAFRSSDPGYVDNVLTGQPDVNRRNSDGGRVSLLWQPLDAFSIKLSGLIQDSTRGGSEDVDRTLGGQLAQSTLRGTGYYTRRSKAYI
jgi:iron complex outermembrane recepter protein